MKNLTYILLIPLLMSSCAGLEPWLKSFANIEEPNALRKSVGTIKSDTETIAKEISSRGLASTSLTEFKNLYNEVREPHNKLIVSIAEKIKANTEVKKDDYSDEIKTIETKAKTFQDEWEKKKGSQFNDELKEAAAKLIGDALKELGKKAGRNAYATSFIKKFSIVKFDELNE